MTNTIFFAAGPCNICDGERTSKLDPVAQGTCVPDATLTLATN